MLVLILPQEPASQPIPITVAYVVEQYEPRSRLVDCFHVTRRDITMLRPSFGLQALPRHTSRAAHVFTRRARHSHSDAHQVPQQLPPVRILRPALWCVAAVGTIYFSLAAFEVRRDVKNLTKYSFKGSPSTYDDLAAAKRGNQDRRHGRSRGLGGPISGSPLDMWKGLSDSDKVIVGNIAINTSIWAANSLTRSNPMFLYHMPAVHRNFTMFTSMFGHVSGMHLLFNMYCLYNFGPAVARAPIFQDGGSHLAAFYLSSGVLASLGAQFDALRPSRRLTAGQGASGAIMALISVFAMSYPGSQIGIIFVPGSVDAQLALGLIAAFETYGVIFGIPFLRLGHSVHLAGLAVGAAYMHFDGKGQVWNATRRIAFNQLRRVNMI